MRRVIVGLLVAACGDNVEIEEPVDETIQAVCSDADLPQLLGKLPHVTTVKPESCGDWASASQCFRLTVTQPVDHKAPDKTFSQFVFLQHRGCDRPTVVGDWGYSQDYFFDDELSVLFGANALWIEHRYQGESLPAFADWKWEALTIENGANDMHRVIESFKHLYGANWVSTGASKGGITATYHSYFFPKDLDGFIPYVAPASRARIDLAYQTYLDTTLTSECAERIRSAQVAALTTRRPMMLTKIRERVGIGYEEAYLDLMTATFDWGFWQYDGERSCNRVPAETVTDDAFWNFYAQFSGFFGPAQEEMSNGALSYEWLTEQGFAYQTGKHVAPLLTSEWATMTMEEQFIESFPDVVLPGYDNGVSNGARHWAEHYAENMLLIYGEYDPWSGGAIDAPQRPTSARYFVPKATHGASISGLDEPELGEAIAHAERMFGVPAMMEAMPRAAQANTKRAQIMADVMRRTMLGGAIARMQR